MFCLPQTDESWNKNKEMVELNKIPGHCRAFPINTRYRFFSANQETFTKVDHILRHKTWSQQIQENGKSLLLSDHKWNKVRSQSQRNYKNLQLWKYSILFSDE